MRISTFYIILCLLLALYLDISAQVRYTEKGQAYPSSLCHFGKEAFIKSDSTVIRWLGSAGFLINSKGTCIMVDPMLAGFDMPLLFQPPILPTEVPSLNAVLITHCDNDHFSIPTCTQLKSVCKEFHATVYVDSLLKNLQLPSFGHTMSDTFRIGSINVRLTPAYHTWQNKIGNSERFFKREDYCGYLIETADGLIWAPGDSRFLPEFLELPSPDAIFFDFSDDGWHIGLDNAVKVANAYPDAQLLLSHWGTVDAPEMKAFNADPKDLEGRIVNPERIHVLAPGEPFVLNAAKKKENGMIFKTGQKAISKYYTGDVYISGLLRNTSYDISQLVFEAGSHNNWHIHPDASQVLLILDGEGYYQEEGKPKQLMKKGDVIKTLPNVKHWHGATPDSRLVHLSITDRSEKGHIQWCEKVTLEEYQD